MTTINESRTVIAPGLPHWEDAPAVWDRLELGPYLMPGIWSLTFRVAREIDVKKSKGSDGARFSDEGYVPAEIQATGRLHTRDDWRSLQAVFRTLHPQTYHSTARGKERSVLRIRHPAAQLLGVDDVYLVAIGAPELDNGIASVRLDLLQWVKAPKKAPKKKDPADDHGRNEDAPQPLAGDPPLRNGLQIDASDPDAPVVAIG